MNNILVPSLFAALDTPISFNEIVQNRYSVSFIALTILLMDILRICFTKYAKQISLNNKLHGDVMHLVM